MENNLTEEECQHGMKMFWVQYDETGLASKEVIIQTCPNCNKIVKMFMNKQEYLNSLN